MPNNPPVDTPFFTRGGRLSEIWHLWLNSLTTAANAVAGALLAANNLSDLVNIATARLNLGLGSAATRNATDFDSAGAANAAVAAIPHASVLVTGLLTSSDWSTFNAKQSALGFTPLNPANNLSELTPATARTNLGLGTAATQPTTAFDPAGAWSSWTGDVNAGGNNLSAANNISAASLQVTSYMNFSGSMFYLSGAGTYFRTANNTVSNWQSFAYYDVQGASIGLDQWGLYVNTRATSGAADGWFPVMQVNALTGNTQFNVPVAITGTLSAPIVKSTGGVYSGVRTVTTNDTATTSDHTIVLNGTSLTETLPASPGAGQELYLVNIAATSATINGNAKSIWAAGTSSASITLAANATTILQYDGTLWRVIK